MKRKGKEKMKIEKEQLMTKEKIYTTRCPVCGGNGNSVTMVRWDYYRFDTVKDWHYHHCATCGTCFCDLFFRWSTVEWGTFVYNREYSLVDPGAGERVRKIFPVINGLLREHAPDAKSLIDYGGGNGDLADMLKAAAYDAYCFDIHGRLDTCPDKADAVTAIEVLEHATAPHMLWGYLREVLNPGGLLMATTETCDGIADISAWFYANPRAGHAVIYSGKALELMAERYHFRPVCQQGPLYVWRAE